MSYLLVNSGVTGQNLYACFYNHDTGWIWDQTNSRWADTTLATGSGNGKINYATNWGNVAVAMTEDEGGDAQATSAYQVAVPAALESKVESVDVVVRERVSTNPAVTDPILAQGSHSVVPHTSYSVSQSR